MQEAIRHLRRQDPVMASIIDRVGDYRIQFRDPDFETLERSIVYQQLSGKVAIVIFGRLAAATGGKLTPAGILILRHSWMTAQGLSAQENDYIRELTRHARDGGFLSEY